MRTQVRMATQSSVRACTRQSVRGSTLVARTWAFHEPLAFPKGAPACGCLYVRTYTRAYAASCARTHHPSRSPDACAQYACARRQAGPLADRNAHQRTHTGASVVPRRQCTYAGMFGRTLARAYARPTTDVHVRTHARTCVGAQAHTCLRTCLRTHVYASLTTRYACRRGVARKIVCARLNFRQHEPKCMCTHVRTHVCVFIRGSPVVSFMQARACAREYVSPCARANTSP